MAFSQLIVFYYGCGCLLHFVVPVLLKVKTVQSEQRKAGSIPRDAFYSLGECMHAAMQLGHPLDVSSAPLRPHLPSTYSCRPDCCQGRHLGIC